MIIQQLINQVIEKSEFIIDENISSLYIKCETTMKAPMNIFIYNPKGIRIGEIAFGYNNFVDYIYISDKKTTMNSLPHELLSGIYTVTVLTYSDEIPKNKNTVTMHISTNEEKAIQSTFLQDEVWFKEEQIYLDFDQCINSESRYYKGDFHAHTFYSDGKNNADQVKDIVKKQGLDFIALTEHNRIPFGFKEIGCLNIPSFELTFDFGHVNIHRVKNIDFSSLMGGCKNTKDLFNKAIECYSQTSNISINHLFLEPWHFSYGELDMTQINTLEIICDPTYPSSEDANDKAVQFLDFLWQSGYQIYAVGGSDSHNLYEERYEGATLPSIYGDPATYVYCNGLSVNHVIDGIRSGRSYISRFVELDIDIMDYLYLPGEMIDENVDVLRYKVTIKGCDQKYRARFVLNNEVIKEQVITEDNPTITLSTKITKEPWWLRFGLYNEEDHLVAYINPIYNRLNPVKEKKLKKLLEKFGEE